MCTGGAQSKSVGVREGGAVHNLHSSVCLAVLSKCVHHAEWVWTVSLNTLNEPYLVYEVSARTR